MPEHKPRLSLAGAGRIMFYEHVFQSVATAVTVYDCYSHCVLDGRQVIFLNMMYGFYLRDPVWCGYFLWACT